MAQLWLSETKGWNYNCSEGVNAGLFMLHLWFHLPTPFLFLQENHRAEFVLCT